MNIATAIGWVTGTGGMVALLWGGMLTLDERYVTAAEFKNIEWGVLRAQVIEDEKRCEANPDDEFACADYEESLDLYCLEFPEARRCRDRSENN